MQERRTLILFCLLLVMGAARSQEFPNLKFNSLTVKDGLSSEIIKQVIQDKRGITWVCSFDGLNRYDGTGFKVYRHDDKDSNSICSNDLRNMVLDGDNSLWIATAKGLCHFNTITGMAVNYYHREQDNNSLADDYLNAVYLDSKKRLWVTGNKGLQRFDPHENIFRTYHMPAFDMPEGWTHFDEYGAVLEDNRHRLWIASFFGLYLLDETQAKLIQYPQPDYVAITCVYQAVDGTIYIGQWGGGVKVFLPDTGEYLPVNFEQDQKAIVLGFAEWKDSRGNNWLCICSDDDIVLAKPGKGIARKYVHDNRNPFSSSSSGAVNVYKDPQQRLWFSTKSGIDVVDPQLQYFNNEYVYQQVDDNNPQVFGRARDMAETAGGYIISSWYGKGVFYFDRNWKITGHVKSIPATSLSLNSRSVFGINIDAAGDIWFATDSGLVRQRGDTYKVYLPPDAVSVIRGDYVMRKIHAVKNGLFWIRAKQNGIYLFDPATGVFLKHYNPWKETDEVHSLCLDKQERLWVGTEKGLFLFDAQQESFKKIGYRFENAGAHFTEVNDLICDENNTLWIAAAEGLGQLDDTMQAAKMFGTAEGLPDKHLIRLQEDSGHRIWIKSLKGITCFDKKNNWRFYTTHNGLPDFYNAYGLFDFNRDGNIISGQSGVLTIFNPNDLGFNDEAPGIAICDVLIDNRTAPLEFRDSTCVVLLQPGQRTMQVHFALTSYTSPLSNRFFYRIPGIANDWVEVQDGNINLANVPVGEFTIYIKGSDYNGIYSREEKILLSVKPYWYQTWWFRILAFVVAATFAIYFVRRRVNNIRKESSLQQKMTEIKMEALRAQMNPHFIFNSLSSIENFIMQNEKRQASDYLNKFSKLIRSILDSSRNEMVPVAKDMEALQWYVDLERLRFDHRFAYQVTIDPGIAEGDYRVPSLLVQPYVENAILHGIAHSERPDLLLKVTLLLENDSIKYIIEDNGVGRIAAADLNRQNKPNHESVGLQITAERIRQFNRETKASVFFVDLYDTNGRACGTRVEVIIKPR